jgi:hypothetical protein
MSSHCISACNDHDKTLWRAYTQYYIHPVRHMLSTAYTQYCIIPRSTVSRSQPASHLSSVYAPCCTQFPSFPQLRLNQWLVFQLPLGLLPDLPPPDRPLSDRPPPIPPPILIDCGLEVDLQCHSIMASKCISKLTRVRTGKASPCSLDPRLHVPHQTDLITASKFAWSWPSSESSTSLNHGFQWHHYTRSIMATKCFSTFNPSWHPSASATSLNDSFQVHMIKASIRAWLQPQIASLSSIDLSHQVHLWTRSVRLCWSGGALPDSKGICDK